jgi:VCBS repeat-containing protein/predicted outer membrane repeat protein
MNKCSIANLIYRMVTTFILLALILAIAPSQVARAATVRYVIPGGLTSGSCGSWGSACDLQYALGIAVSGDELWVKQGTYKPTTGSSRDATFQLKSGVAIYGGFVGTETARGQRNWASLITTLSGDIGTPGDNTDNSYSVVTGSGTDNTSILDGFTISGGNANGGINEGNGGGMYNLSGSPSIANIIFDSNSASFRGGGMYNYTNSPILKNVKFINNSAGYYGGGLFTHTGSLVKLSYVTFINNTSGWYGGGMHSNMSNVTMANVSFDSNTAGHYGGGLVAADFDLGILVDGIIDGIPDTSLNGGGSIDVVNIALVNATFIGNSSDQIGGGMYILHTGPILANVTFNDNSAVYYGGGIYNSASTPSVHNSILWGNNPDQVFNDVESNSTITYSDLESGCPAGSTCTSVINSNPLFVNLATGDLRLRMTSPAIDAGDNSRVPVDTLDLDNDGNTSEPLPYDLAGKTRFINIPGIPDTGNGTPPIVDMGAYERQLNSAPVAVNNNYSTNEDTQLTVSAPGVLGNDTDTDGDPLTAVLNSSTTHGTLTFNSDGSFDYTPALNYNGSDSFTYHANDGALNSSIATVSITITPVNDAPVANSQSVTTAEDTLKAITLTATDVDGDPLTWSIVTPPAHGALTGTAPNLNYTPNLNYNGPDSFTFKVRDGTVDSNIATVSITITPVNDAPVANPQSVTTTEDTAKAITLTATDVEGDTLTWSIVTPPAHGTLTGTAPALTYTPDANYNGPDSFTFKVNDGHVDSNVATVTITVTPVNDAPVAVVDSYVTNEDTTLIVDAPGVLGNDTDAENDPLTAILNVGPTHGDLTLNANGSFVYTPDANYFGIDSFTYHANDGKLDSNIATVTIVIMGQGEIVYMPYINR